MKAKPPEAERALDKPGTIRLFLLYGPDESGSRALAARLPKALGAEAERVDFSAAQLKADPALLADEAAAISLFGGPRYIRIEPASDDAADAVAALLEAPAGGNPVVAIAGALKPDAKLVKLASASPHALACASYPPDAGNLDRAALECARTAGLEMTPDVARRLAAATGGDRMVLAQEVEKLALYLDAAPDRRRAAGHEALDALLADASEGSLGRLVDATLDGRADAAMAELARLAGDGVAGVPVLLAIERRLVQLAGLRAEVERGNAVDRVVEGARPPVFWKDKDTYKRQLMRWTARDLAQAIGRVLAAKRATMRGGGPGPVAVDEEVLTLTRHAARLRR